MSFIVNLAQNAPDMSGYGVAHGFDEMPGMSFEDYAGEQPVVLEAEPDSHGGDVSSGQGKLACPFFKRSPNKYRHSRSCTGPGWASVRRVK